MQHIHEGTHHAVRTPSESTLTRVNLVRDERRKAAVDQVFEQLEATRRHRNWPVVSWVGRVALLKDGPPRYCVSTAKGLLPT